MTEADTDRHRLDPCLQVEATTLIKDPADKTGDSSSTCVSASLKRHRCPLPAALSRLALGTRYG